MADLVLVAGAPVRRLDGADKRTLGLLGDNDPASNKYRVTWEDGRETWEALNDLGPVDPLLPPRSEIRDSVPPPKPKGWPKPVVQMNAVMDALPAERGLGVGVRVTRTMNGLSLKDAYDLAIAWHGMMSDTHTALVWGPTFFGDGSIVRVRLATPPMPARYLVAVFDKPVMEMGWYSGEELQIHPLPPELRVGEYVRSLSTPEKRVGVVTSFKKDLVFVTWPAAGCFGGEQRADLVSAIYDPDFADPHGQINVNLHTDEVPFSPPPEPMKCCETVKCCETPSPAKVELPTFVEEAFKTIRGNREGTYGSPVVNLGTIATYWSGDLTVRLREVLKPGAKIELDAVDVCRLMVLMKQARLAASPRHRDSHVDTVGYTDCSDILQRAEQAK